MKIIALIAIAFVFLLVSNSLYKVNETEQVIITQFGKPVGDAVTDAGLKFKIPFIQKVNPIEKRIDERSAQSRLDDILGSETRNAVAKHELIEIIRTTKDRQPLLDASLTEADLATLGTLVPISKGRKLVEQEIFSSARPPKLRCSASNSSTFDLSGLTTMKVYDQKFTNASSTKFSPKRTAR